MPGIGKVAWYANAAECGAVHVDDVRICDDPHPPTDAMRATRLCRVVPTGRSRTLCSGRSPE
ncbi:hypothetical protein GCM10018954_091770 [Kutzneria kofuensis]